MSDEQMSTERKLATMKMHEALKLAEGKHAERGVEMMLDVLEMDPKFVEPRKWLAEYYLVNDKTHMAVSQYEEILRYDPENNEIRDKLREVDPATAERLERLQNVAPDPFVAARAQSSSSGELDDFEDDDYADDDDNEGLIIETHVAGADLFADDETCEEVYYDPLPWEHEQEREYRDRLDESDAFIGLLNGYADLWYDAAAWDRMLADCHEADEAVAAANDRACAALGAETTRVLLVDEWLRIPLTAPLPTPTVIISSRAPEVMTEHELVFWLAWASHTLLGGAAEYAWPCEAPLPHSAKISAMGTSFGVAAQPHIEGWDEGLSEEELGELARNCQAWEMRAVMSADRAGLLAVGEEAVAARAIAAGSVDPKHSAAVTSTQFLGIFRAKEVKELARIGMKSNPWFDQQYAAYRSHFLRWWATTDEFKQLKADTQS